MPELISLDDLTAAAARIAPVAVRTPLLPFDAASERLGADIWLKPEMLLQEADRSLYKAKTAGRNRIFA